MFAKTAVFCHGRLEKFSRDLNVHSAIVRLQVDGEFFFTDLRQFTGYRGLTDLFKKLEALEAGQELFLGGHQLGDGSTWLHWLLVPDKMQLRPAQPDDAADENRNRLLVWSVLTVICVLPGLGIMATGTTASVPLGAAGLLIFGGLAGCGWAAYKSAVNLVHSGSAITKEMYRGWISCESALAAGRPWRSAGLEPARPFTPPPLPMELPLGTALIRIDEAGISEPSTIMSTGHGVATAHFMVYELVHQGQTFSWLAGSLLAMDETKPASSRNGHQTFLAKGDEVIIFYSPRINRNMTDFINTLATPMAGRPIIELFNLTDQSAYVSVITYQKNPAMWYFMTGVVGAFSFAAFLVMGLFMSSGVLEFLRLIAFFIPTMIFTLGFMVLVGEMIDAVGYDREIAEGQARWHEFVAPFKRKPGPSSPALHSGAELWAWFLPRRFKILAAAMIVSALCLLPLFFMSD